MGTDANLALGAIGVAFEDAFAENTPGVGGSRAGFGARADMGTDGAAGFLQMIQQKVFDLAIGVAAPVAEVSIEHEAGVVEECL